MISSPGPGQSIAASDWAPVNRVAMARRQAAAVRGRAPARAAPFALGSRVAKCP